MHYGVELTAYLVNESRARRPDLARDPLAHEWVPPAERAAVRDLWDEYARRVYPHDDLVVSLRGRHVLEVLEEALRQDPETVLVVCGAGFSSYQWLLPVHCGVEVDLPGIIEAKQRRAAALATDGVLPERDVTYLPADLTDPSARHGVVERVRALANGRPVAYVAEGVVFYLPRESARAVAQLGTSFADCAVAVVTYWPRAASGNQVLAAQRDWFRSRHVPEDASYLSVEDFAAQGNERMENFGPEELQVRYLGEVVVATQDLVPEYIMVIGR